MFAKLFESNITLFHSLELFFELFNPHLALLIVLHHRLTLLHEAHAASILAGRKIFNITRGRAFTFLIKNATIAEVAPLEPREGVVKCFVPLQVDLERLVLNSAFIRAALLMQPHIF